MPSSLGEAENFPRGMGPFPALGKDSEKSNQNIPPKTLRLYARKLEKIEKRNIWAVKYGAAELLNPAPL